MRSKKGNAFHFLSVGRRAGRWVAWGFLALGGMAWSGCLTVQNTMTLRADGSGTLSIDAELQSLQMIRMIPGAQDQNPQQILNNLPKPEEMRQQIQQALSTIKGLTVQESQMAQKGQGLEAHFTLAFADLDALNAYQTTQNPTLSFQRDNNRLTCDGTVRPMKEMLQSMVDHPLVMANLNAQQREQVQQASQMFDQVMAQMGEQIKAMAQSVKMTYTLRFPWPVVEGQGVEVHGQQATWTMTGDQLFAPDLRMRVVAALEAEGAPTGEPGGTGPGERVEPALPPGGMVEPTGATAPVPPALMARRFQPGLIEKRGAVQVRRPGGAWAPAAEGMSLAVGDVIRVQPGGLAVIGLGSGAAVRLGSNAILAIQERQVQLLPVRTACQAWFRVPPGAAFVLGLPGGTVTTSEGLFSVQYRRDLGSRVLAREGSVRVAAGQPPDERAVTLEPRQQVLLMPDRAPVPPGVMLESEWYQWERILWPEQ